MGFLDNAVSDVASSINGAVGNAAQQANAMEEYFMDKQFGMNEYFMDKRNAFSRQEAKINREFQEKMSNTSYQRAVEDMKKAGINPILAASQGGASTPSGSRATSRTASVSKGSAHMQQMSELRQLAMMLNGAKNFMNTGTGQAVKDAVDKGFEKTATGLKSAFSNVKNNRKSMFENIGSKANFYNK